MLFEVDIWQILEVFDVDIVGFKIRFGFSAKLRHFLFVFTDMSFGQSDRTTKICNTILEGNE